MAKPSRKKTTKRRNGIADLAGLVSLVKAAPMVGSRRKRNGAGRAGWMRAKAVRVRRAGGNVMLDILR